MQAGIALSARPARLAGRVTMDAKAVVAAPVFLLPVNAETRRGTNGLRTTHTDAQGNYRFEGLPPGPYLALSSFDVADVNEQTMAAAQAKAIALEEGGTLTLDLEIYQLQ